MCPPGFTYVPSATRCCKVVYEGHDWYSAGKKCQKLHRGSHLAAVTSATENKVLKPFLASELSSMCKCEHDCPKLCHFANMIAINCVIFFACICMVCVYLFARMYVCMYVHVCMYVCMHACMYVCMRS